jgi:hypothetical protein
MKCASPTLPVQAIIHDKNTWFDGGLGFSLDRTPSNTGD